MALRGESRVHHSANMDSNNHQIVLWEKKKVVGLIGSLFEFGEKVDVDLGFTDFLVAVHLSLPVKMWETPEKEKQIVTSHTSFSFHTLGGFLKRRYFDIVLLKHQNYHSAPTFFFFSQIQF